MEINKQEIFKEADKVIKYFKSLKKPVTDVSKLSVPFQHNEDDFAEEARKCYREYQKIVESEIEIRRFNYTILEYMKEYLDKFTGFSSLTSNQQGYITSYIDRNMSFDTDEDYYSHVISLLELITDFNEEK